MIYLDFETKSYAELGGARAVGSWCYSHHWSTDAICLAWAVDDGDILAWGNLPEYESDPLDHLFDAIADGHDVEALNYSFEYSIWHNVMVQRYGWPAVDISRWQDVGAVAAYYAMPTGLEKLAQALEMGGKDPEGGRLITKYSKLNLKTAKKVIPLQDFTKFVNYCKDDVRLERQISWWLGPLPEDEQKVFEMDKVINLRGLPLDTKENLGVAIKLVEDRTAELVQEFRDITGYGPRQHAQVKQWFASQGIVLENMQAKYLKEKLRKLRKFLPPHVERAFDLRSASYKSSADKLRAMARHRGRDGKARFQCKYHGAVTGRPTGTGMQPLNLSRGFDNVSPEKLIGDILRGDPNHLDNTYGSTIEAVGKSSRNWIRASKDHQFFAGDFSSVEAVVLACMAGEDWKVQLFHEGAEIYMRTAEKIYKLAPGTITDKEDPRRQDGKTCELAFGYQGNVGAWRNFDNSDRHTDEAVKQFCKDWRASHPAIVAWWAQLQEAAISALRVGRGVHKAGPVGFEVVDAWLTMVLPDGKRLWYFDAALEMRMPHWHVVNPHYDDFRLECFEKRCNCEPQLTVTYKSYKNGNFSRRAGYGGLWSENAVQGTSRQILKEAMFRVEEAGYPILMTVYDEIFCEVPKGHGSVKEFEKLMVDFRGSFCDGWPIGVKAWKGGRYKK
jgi:DNA polymerase